MKLKFTPLEVVLLFVIAGTGIVLRWYDLSARPFHHDEALYAVYGKYFLIDPVHKFYRYDPLLHGPFMFHVLPWFYKIFGTTKWAARSLVTMLGTLFIFAPLLFRKFLNKNALILLIAYISLSPSLIYWSRFLRHDYLMILFMLLFLVSLILLPPRWKLFCAPIALSMQFCIKENAYIFLFLLTMALPLVSLKNPQTIPSLLRQYRRHLLAGIIVGLALYCYFYSGGLRYWQGIADGLYRKSLSYWWHQHHIERIKGPFIYQLLFLCWYELLFIVGIIIHMIHFYLNSARKNTMIILGALGVTTFCHYFFRNDMNAQTNWGQYFIDFFKLKTPLDFYPLIIIPTHSLLLLSHLIRRKQFGLTFWGYLFFANFFVYSYVGEKVPWLSLYPLLIGLIFLALYFPWKKYHLYLGLALIIPFNLHQTILTNYSNAGLPNELIGQVHTAQEYEKQLLILQNKLEGPPPHPMIYVNSNNTWPATWFFYGHNEYKYHPQARLELFDYIFTDLGDKKTALATFMTHNQQTIPFRHWWVPDYRTISWRHFLKYALWHQPWNQPGSQQMSFFYRVNYNQ